MRKWVRVMVLGRMLLMVSLKEGKMGKGGFGVMGGVMREGIVE